MSATESPLNLSCLASSNAAPFRPFSQIPWLEKYEEGVYNMSLLPGDFYIKEATKDKQNLVLAMGNAVPIFLPAKYHQMRCGFPKSTAALKEQWDAAFEFVYSCGKFDHDYMSKVFKDVNVLGKNMPMPELSTLKASRKTQLCQSAAEILLEPWVLIQMPFQPALLHQWAVALLAEALTFQKKISPIFSYGCPEKFVKIAECLRTMMSAMERCAYFALHMYICMCGRGEEINITLALFELMGTFSSDLLKKALPVIEFVTSKEANGVILSIKKLFLKELNGGHAHPPQVLIANQSQRLYDFGFWTTECELKAVYGGMKHNDVNSILLFKWSTEEHVCSLEHHCRCATLWRALAFVSERLLQTKWLAGIDLDSLMAVLKKQNITKSFLPHIRHLQHFAKLASRTEGKTDDRVRGVLDDIICLSADVKISGNFDLLARRIFDVAKKAHPEVTIGNSMEDSPNVEYALPEIESKFEQILANDKWTWEKILADAKSTCGELDEISNADIIDHPQKVFQHFQTRIRKLVHKMAEKHFTSWKAGRFEFFPEQQFVQYLLPCFVNCFLGPLADKSKNQAAVKRKCVRFVEELICCYEQQEYSQVLATTEKKIDIQNITNKIESECQETFKDFLAKFLNVSKETFSSIFPTVAHFLEIFEADSLKPNDIECFFEANKWYIHMDMFLLRSVSILKNLNIRSSNWDSEVFFIVDYIDNAFHLNDVYYVYIREIYYQSCMSSSEADRRIIDMIKTSMLPKELTEAAKNISCHQLAALLVCMRFGNLDTPQVARWKSLQGPAFPFDMTSLFIWCAATGDTWKIKQLVAPMLMTKSRRGDQLKDYSFVSLQVAKSNKCYKPILEKISPDGSKVLMKEKGEITFMPVKHCRWCGLIKAEKLRLCSLCEENSDYCDINYFCSEKCELEALASKHREEHARFFIVKLGLE